MYIYIDTISIPSRVVVFSSDKVVMGKVLIEKRHESEELLPAIDRLIKGKKEEIGAIYVNSGAGSFTSVRVGVTIANFLGLALNIQPVSVQSEKEIDFAIAQEFTTPVLPNYKEKPMATPKRMDLNGL